MASTPDLSEFHQLSARDQRLPCKVAVALDQLSAEDREKAEAALTRPKEEIPGGAIEKWFAARGIRVNNQSIAYHRRSRCRCADERA